MPQSKLARIGLVISCAGCAVLGTSLTLWALKGPHALYYTTHTYEWLDARQSDKPAVATDEFWHASADCLRPYFRKKLDEAQASLRAHNQAKPRNIGGVPLRLEGLEGISARLRHEAAALTAVAKHLGGPVTTEEAKAIEEAASNNDAFISADWFPAHAALEIRVKRWQAELSGVSDREMLLSDALNAKRGDIMKLGLRVLQAKNDQELVAFASKALLKLSAFSDVEAETIRTACVNVVPIKQVVATTAYHTEVGQWPSEHPTAFWAGLSLLVVGMLMAPVLRWVGAGKS